MARPRPETLAAVLNGLAVMLLPLLLLAWADFQSQMNTNTRVTVRPPGASIVLGEIEKLNQPAIVLLPFAALAVWRTRVYARRVIARASRGWAAVGEAAACAFGVMFVMNVPLLVKHTLPMSLFAMAYLVLAVALGVAVGIVLRATALFALWLQAPNTSSPV
jgi:hypothetical protein